jgi:hypothetical protein
VKLTLKQILNMTQILLVIYTDDVAVYGTKTKIRVQIEDGHLTIHTYIQEGAE